MKKALGWLIEQAILWGGFYLLLCGAGKAYTLIHETNCTWKRVKVIGACNFLATCAVRFEDGSAGVAERPLVGELSCVR